MSANEVDELLFPIRNMYILNMDDYLPDWIDFADLVEDDLEDEQLEELTWCDECKSEKAIDQLIGVHLCSECMSEDGVNKDTFYCAQCRETKPRADACWYYWHDPNAYFICSSCHS